MGALCADRAVAQWVTIHHPVDKHNWAIVVLKLPGVYWTTLCIAALLFAVHPQRLRAAMLPLASGAIGGLAYLFIKWIVGRQRPDKSVGPFDLTPFMKGLRGLMTQSGLCFPSGHTTLAFATAMSLAILIPSWRIVWFTIAFAVGIERVLEHAHYPSDVVGGIALGTLSAVAAYRLLERYWPADQMAIAPKLPAGK